MALQAFVRWPVALTASLSLCLAGCGGGDSGSSSPAPTPSPSASGHLYAVPAQEALTVADVQQVIAQAVGEAQARGKPAIIAVTDRVGNVLAVFRMNGAPMDLTTSPLTGAQTKNLEPFQLRSQFIENGAAAGAIAKAITAAYLSSSGNAFSTRTASMIVQPHFPPSEATKSLPSGPLFGVQFSQLPCSDLAARYTPGNAGTGAFIGPKRSPLGLAADPGGLPLYKNGVVVGGVGVMSDGDYGYDPDIVDVDADDEEFTALAGTQGFEAPEAIRADQIHVAGVALRFSDATAAGLHALQTSYAAIADVVGTLLPVTGYFDGTAIVAGTAYGTERSGVRAATASEFGNVDAFVLTDGAGQNRYPVRAGTDAADVGTALSAAEVRAVLEQAFIVMSRARAQIRQPLDSRAQVTISVVDTYGTPLGLVRSPDAPIFGTDVSLQKARTAAFFSNPQAGAQLSGDPATADFVTRARTFLGDANALTGQKAFSDRAGGNLSRPYFPDGEPGRPNGPFSEPLDQWSPFATGLQAALIVGDVVAHVGYVQGRNATDVKHQCSTLPNAPGGKKRVANGIQIFPGSVPIYRGTQLVGAIGVSGDGIDQDDMISFLGVNNGGKKAGGIGNAPADKRADTIVVNVGEGVRLRYVSCPFAPFLDTNEQNVCEGL